MVNPITVTVTSTIYVFVKIRVSLPHIQHPKLHKHLALWCGGHTQGFANVSFRSKAAMMINEEDPKRRDSFWKT